MTTQEEPRTTTATTPTSPSTTTQTTPAARPGRLLRLRRWLVATTSTTEPGTALALFRIGVGLSILWLVLPMLLTAVGRDVVVFSFVDAGAVDTGDTLVGYRNVRGSPGVKLFGGGSADVIFGFLWVSAVGALLMTVGLFGRASVLVVAVATRVAFSQNGEVSGAGDALMGNALLLLLLGDVTATWSLDCRLRTGRFVDDTPVSAWPRQVALVQLCIVYTTTGLQKLISTTWTPLDGFSALYQILQSPHWARFPHLVKDHSTALLVPLALMTAVTIVWEVTFVVVLWKKRWRLAYAVIGVGVHLGIYVLMEVGIFSIISLAFYPVIFSPEVWSASKALFEKVLRRQTKDAAAHM